jgi:hypothetical protein
VARKFHLAHLAWLLALAPGMLSAQAKAPASCGKTAVSLPHPTYLKTAFVIVIAQAPDNWTTDTNHGDVLYFIPSGETFKAARTIMYVRPEPLADSLSDATKRDEQHFQKSCSPVEIKRSSTPPLLDEECDHVTQIYSCAQLHGSYVEKVTKIAINGVLLNVVISADSLDQISRYNAAYEYVLQHVTIVH